MKSDTIEQFIENGRGQKCVYCEVVHADVELDSVANLKPHCAHLPEIASTNFIKPANSRLAHTVARWVFDKDLSSLWGNSCPRKATVLSSNCGTSWQLECLGWRCPSTSIYTALWECITWSASGCNYFFWEVWIGGGIVVIWIKITILFITWGVVWIIRITEASSLRGCFVTDLCKLVGYRNAEQ